MALFVSSPRFTPRCCAPGAGRMMNEPTVTLVIGIDGDGRQAILPVPRSSPDTLRAIVENAMRNFGRRFLPSGYGVRLDSRWLPLHQTIAEAIPDLDQREKIILTVGKLPSREAPAQDIPTLAAEEVFEAPAPRH